MQKFPLWQRLLSYLMPIRLKTVQSELSGELQINLYRGRKILDTKEVNYSFGALHTVMEKAIARALKLNPSPGSALLLGYGGGSAAYILRKHLPGISITAVEMDEKIIAIAREEFYSDNVQIIHGDALKYIQEPHAFDLIICDIFIGRHMPASYASDDFYEQLRQNLLPSGVLLLNTITTKRLACELAARSGRFFPVQQLLKIFDNNYILLGKAGS